MKETFLFAFRAILPVLLLILFGYLTKQFGPWSGEFFSQLNSLCFHLLLPINLFVNIYQVEAVSDVNWRILFFFIGGVFLCMGIGVLFASFVQNAAQKGVIVQAAFRSNQAILGLSLVESLGGAEAMGFASISTSLSVPLFNVLAVAVLTYYSGRNDTRTRGWELLDRIIRNPLVLSALLGGAVLCLRSCLPTENGIPIFTIREQMPSVYAALVNLSRTASPLMLFVLGTRLTFTGLKGMMPMVGLGTTLRLVVSPAVVIALALTLRDSIHLTKCEIPTLITLFASPVAVSSSVMVQEIGGDTKLSSQLVVWSSVFSMFSLFVCIAFMRGMGVL